MRPLQAGPQWIKGIAGVLAQHRQPQFDTPKPRLYTTLDADSLGGALWPPPSRDLVRRAASPEAFFRGQDFWMRVELLEGVFLVGSGRFNFTHPLNCNIYAVRGDDRIVLIDAGCGFDVDGLEAALKNSGIPLTEIDSIYHTHSHWDHARGAAEVARRAGCNVYIHRQGVEILEKGPWTEFNFKPHPAITFTPIHNVLALEDGDEIKLGGRTLRVLYTPGHTADSVCFAIEEGGKNHLFTGDTVMGFGKPGIMTANTDFPSYRSSLQRLVEYRADAMYPGHGIWILDYAYEQIQHLTERLNGKWTDFGIYPPPFDSGNWVVMRHPELLE